MIERIALYKLVPAESNDAGREAALRELAAVGEGADQYVVGVPADEASLRSWDLSLVMRFESVEARDAYLASDAFQTHESAFEDRTEIIKHWTFELR